MWDDTGACYLDFTSGIAVNALGHSHPRWVAAVQRQAAELVHVSNLFRNPNQGELARRITCHAGPGRVFFCNSGAEANEGLIKLARLHGRRRSGGEEGKRFKVICARNAFHGRTFGGMSATPQEKIQGGFRPLVPGFAFGELNDVASFAALVDDTTAAIFVETIQGEGGVMPCTPEFLLGLRRLCDEHGLMLILDEVQCGVARSGTLYAYEQYGIIPDIMATAKGLGGGFPVGACLATEEAARGMVVGTHGSTYGGNPFAMAACQAVWDVVANDEFLAQVRSTGDKLRSMLEQFIGNYPDLFTGVRGKGLMLGVMMTHETRPFVAHLRDNHGLLLVAAGDNTFRVLPPLNIGDAEIQTCMEKLSAGAASYQIPQAA